MSKNPMLDIKLIAAQTREMMFAPPVRIRRYERRDCDAPGSQDCSRGGPVKVYDSPEQGPLHLCENCWRIENEYNRLNRSWTAAFEPEEA